MKKFSGWLTDFGTSEMSRPTENVTRSGVRPPK
jgi:hypothetical protein